MDNAEGAIAYYSYLQVFLQIGCKLLASTIEKSTQSGPGNIRHAANGCSGVDF
ncbi:hypothetical protein ACE1CI_01705 [Aerosakkonemataceae cyanobacterium BLCC-F50]|uniref:Uncharacterized protein n=1 Tax=Floridaenema flaviceps BLCC-F50 TaxID=3153642 RepID=A0ABV4XIU5_9CYAN